MQEIDSPVLLVIQVDSFTLIILGLNISELYGGGGEGTLRHFFSAIAFYPLVFPFFVIKTLIIWHD